MKHFVFTLCFILFCGGLFSQDCPPNASIALTTQGQIDSFATNYPGCTELRFFTIGGSDVNTPSNITNLNGLSQLTSILRSMYIGNNPNLINLNGLQNISYADDLYVSNNDVLINLEGLEQISTLDRFSISDNDNLMNLTGLQNLSVTGELSISNNATLTNLEGLEGTIGLEELTIRNNDNLVNLKGLDSLKSVVGDQSTLSFSIRSNNSLSDLTALSSLDTVARFSIMNNDALINLNGLEGFAVEKLIIDNNNSLTNIDGLDNLTAHFSLEIINNDNLNSFNGLANSTVSQLIIDNNINLTNTEGLESLSVSTLKISNNPSLTSLEGLTNINIIVSLEVVNNDVLTNLTGLENLTYSYDPYYYRNISISNNDVLVSLEGLNNLDSVQRLNIISNPLLGNLQALEQLAFADELTISNNDLLTDLSGLENVNIKDLNIRYNDALVDLTALQNLTELDKLELRENDNLTNLTGLNNLTRLNANYSGGALWILDNGALVDISALSGLTHLESGIRIQANNSLTNLTGLENITYLLNDISIANNPVLSDISALNILPYYGNIGVLRIYENPNLSTCSHEGICYYLASENPAYITGNAAGCSSIEEVLDMCDLSSIICPIGDVTLASQSQIDSFPIAYPGCTRIEGNLTISSASNVNPINQISIVTGNLNICNNPSLTNLNSLADIEIGGDFIFKNNDGFTEIENRFNFNGGVYIEDNDALMNILDLTIYIPDVTYLRIANNPNLSMCGIGYDPFYAIFGDICEHLWLNKPAEIFNNAQGCNSINEVQVSCIFLPITLTDFQAKINNKTTLLTWETATESNNAGFEIQRSIDGINWEKIAWQDGQGTTTNAHTYTHRDENPLFGTSYYRLKQVDFDGAFEYTHIVQVNYEGRDISIFPNPVKNTLHIADLNGGSIQHISIYDQTGGAILSRQMPDNTVDVSSLLPGMYILKIAVEGEVFYRKFIINE